MTDETITVIGNIGQEPERRATSSGEVVEFSVARNDRERQPDGTWTDTGTTWFQVTAWDRLGANAAASLHRGQPVVVHGVLQTREWQGRDGQARVSTTLKARAIGHDLSQGVTAFSRPAAAAHRAPVPAASQPAAAAAPADRPAPHQEPLEPAPVGWSTVAVAEEETPF